MTVDVHTYVFDPAGQLGALMTRRLERTGREPWDKPLASPEAHERAMEAVDHAIILGFSSKHLGVSVPHAHVAAAVRHSGGRFIGFAGIDPQSDDALASLDEAMSLGLRGVVISPAAQAMHPADDAAMRLYERCQRDGLPVVVLPAADLGPAVVMAFGQPHMLDEVARTFPKLRLVIGELGHPWISQTLSLVANHDNVYADLACVVGRRWELYDALVRAHEQGVTDRLLLGSGFPYTTPAEAIANLYATQSLTLGTRLPTIPREALRGIVERDALRCLGLPPAPHRNAGSPTIVPAMHETTE